MYGLTEDDIDYCEEHEEQFVAGEECEKCKEQSE